MRLYTTCASCGEQLAVIRARHTTHDGCPPSPRPIDALERAFLTTLGGGEDAAQAEADRLASLIDTHDTRPANLLGAALAYRQWGWPVFPCRPGGKTPLIRRADGGHGLHDATTDEAAIRDWWAATPTANVALATGHAFDVLDVDPAGLRAWADLRADDPSEAHGIVATPRGGLHVYLTPTGGGNLTGFQPGLDYRGTGGYVLAPPSVLHPAALGTHPVPPWPLTYLWRTYPSPVLTGGGPGGVGAGAAS